jgi:hypothetical protein
MGPKGAKTAQNGPKCPPNDPKLRTKVPLRKATLSLCVWASNSQVSPVGGHITAKNGQKGAHGGRKWAHNWPKQPKMGPCAPKMTPNLGQRFPYIRPPYHHVCGPPISGWRWSAATLLPKMAINRPMEAENGSARGQNTLKWAQMSRMTPNLVKGFPYVRPPYHPVFGPPTPGWNRSATTLLLKLARNGPLEAEMGPQGAKWAQNGPKCPQNDPKPRCKVPLRKVTQSPCVWAPDSQPAPVGSHKTS